MHSEFNFPFIPGWDYKFNILYNVVSCCKLEIRKEKMTKSVFV